MSFYRSPPDLLSQGDLISDIPWGLVEAPITLCRPANSSPHGKADYSTVEDWKIPGQSRPKPWAKNPETIHAIGWRGWVISLWHDCQIDKAENQNVTDAKKAFAAVAAVVPLTVFQDEQSLEAVLAGTHHSFFHLPAINGSGIDFPASAVSFRYIWSVRQSALLSTRRASLSIDAVAALYQHLFVFFTRTRLDIAPTCPTCGTTVPLQAVVEE